MGKNEMELFEKYCEKIGVTFGNLYVREDPVATIEIEFYHSTEYERNKKQSFLYDCKSGNVHMFPYDKECALSCAKTVNNKWQEIKSIIKSTDEINIIIDKIDQIPEEIRKKYKNKIIHKVTKPWAISAFKGTDYDNAKYLFTHSCVVCNNTVYDLGFNRFYFDNDNRVNCILLCFQIKVYEKNEKNEKNEKEPRSIDFYPKTPFATDKEKWRIEEVYYNFDEESIYSSAKDIAKALLKFVIETEEKSN